MIFYYLDASAWVKRYYQESGTTWIQNLFDRDQILACASLGLVEVMATLARKCKAREIERPLFEQKARELGEDWENFVHIQITTEVVNMGKELAKELALRGADALHLASALLLQDRFAEENDQLIFVTSDHELKDAAQGSGITVIDPDEQEKQLPKTS